jgi:hypothetical protein
MEIGVFAGFLILAVDLWVVWRITHSAAGHWRKAIWIVSIILAPVIAHVAWYLTGPGKVELR